MKPQVSTSPPYSRSVSIAGWIWTSGQLPVTEAGITPRDFREQCQVSFEKLFAVVRDAGGAPSSIVKINVYLKDIDLIPELNAVYRHYFPDGACPARTTVEVSSFRGETLIEVDAVARITNQTGQAEIREEGKH